MAIGFGTGCKKSGDDPKVVEAASKLPGAADVRAAIDKKDYDGAVAALVKVQQALTTEDQNVQFRVLAWQARQKMNEAAVTNAQAADAVNAVRGYDDRRSLTFPIPLSFPQTPADQWASFSIVAASRKSPADFDAPWESIAQSRLQHPCVVLSSNALTSCTPEQS